MNELIIFELFVVDVPVEQLSTLVSEAISKIRFLSLTAEEFTAGPGLSPLLSSEEKLAITMNIHILHTQHNNINSNYFPCMM